MGISYRRIARAPVENGMNFGMNAAKKVRVTQRAQRGAQRAQRAQRDFVRLVLELATR
jgi:hypothetical protein